MAAATTVLAALFIGVPTAIVRTGLFARMTPATWWDYPVWAVSAALVGLTVATYVRADGAMSLGADRSRRTLGAAVLSGLAVGCPVCNKLVVAVVGVSGADAADARRAQPRAAARRTRATTARRGRLPLLGGVSDLPDWALLAPQVAPQGPTPSRRGL